MTPHDTLVFICDTTEEAVRAAARLPRMYDLGRFFLFLGARPAREELQWMHSQDNYLVLERVGELSDAPAIAVRAALLYDQGWNLLFCEAKNPPTEQDIAHIRQSLLENTCVRQERIWGVAREHVALYGLPELSVSRPEAGSDTLSSGETDEEAASELEMLKALEGRPASLGGVLLALAETVLMKEMHLHPSARFATPRCQHILKRILERAVSREEEFPAVILLGDGTTGMVFEEALRQIPPFGAVILVGRDEVQEQIYEGIDILGQRPYREFELTDGMRVWIYGAMKD